MRSLHYQYLWRDQYTVLSKEWGVRQESQGQKEETNYWARGGAKHFSSSHESRVRGHPQRAFLLLHHRQHGDGGELQKEEFERRLRLGRLFWQVHGLSEDHLQDFRLTVSYAIDHNKHSNESWFVQIPRQHLDSEVIQRFLNIDIWARSLLCFLGKIWWKVRNW